MAKEFENEPEFIAECEKHGLSMPPFEEIKGGDVIDLGGKTIGGEEMLLGDHHAVDEENALGFFRHAFQLGLVLNLFRCKLRFGCLALLSRSRQRKEHEKGYEQTRYLHH